MQTTLDITVPQMTRPEWWNEPDVVYSIGVSGGKDSTAVLLWMLHNSGIPRDRLDVTFSDTGNEHAWTYAHVQLLNDKLHPIQRLQPVRGFFDMALFKHRFPSPVARFCTEELKIQPTQDHIQRLKASGKRVIQVSGVRADESDDRRDLPEWDYSGTYLCHSWRPLIRWKLADVLAIHATHEVPLNPLYALGAQRVGCWPCIMSRKAEIRIIALKFPERITQIREAELEFEKVYGRFSSFFGQDKCPPRFCSREAWSEDKGRMVPFPTIDDVVKWSLTGDKAQGSWEDEPVKEPVSCNSGACE